MKSFRRGEKGFTLIELLIVVAILGVLAAVVIPNVVGLMGRGGKQAYSTDSKTIQLAAATFYSDVHDGFYVGADNLANATADNMWGFTAGNLTTAGHYYPTALGIVSAHVLTLHASTVDANNPNNHMVCLGDGTTQAVAVDIQDHAIWMGLLVNAFTAGYVAPAGTVQRWQVSPLDGEDSLYLNEIPKSATYSNLYNGDPDPTSSKSGGYTWVVGKNGVVYGAYTLNNGATWYDGFGGAYP